MRYFIVTYLYGEGSLGSGLLTFRSEKYPNFKYLKEKINVDNFSIINIMELSKDDFDNFER